MASHGTQRRYVEGCRCDDCKEAHRISARDYSERRASGQTRPAAVHEYATSVVSTPTYEPGPVESGVEAEIVGLAELRPGLAQVAWLWQRFWTIPGRSISNRPLRKCWSRSRSHIMTPARKAALQKAQLVHGLTLAGRVGDGHSQSSAQAGAATCRGTRRLHLVSRSGALNWLAADFTLASSGAARQEKERHGVESNDGLPFATAALASALGVGAARPATGLPNGGDLREPDKPTRITGRWRWAGRSARQIG
jgi:hypothetical protein